MMVMDALDAARALVRGERVQAVGWDDPTAHVDWCGRDRFVRYRVKDGIVLDRREASSLAEISAALKHFTEDGWTIWDRSPTYH